MTFRARIKSLLRVIKQTLRSKRFQLAVALLVGGFVLINLVLLGVFASRTYPGTTLNAKPLGTVQYSNLEQKVTEQKMVPDQLKMKINDSEVSLPPTDLGVAVDVSKTSQTIRAARSWMPIANLINPPVALASYSLDGSKLSERITALNKKYATEPKDAQIVQVKRSFEIKKESDGKRVNAIATQAYFSNPGDLSSLIELPLETMPAKVTASTLDASLQTVRKQAGVKVTYQYAGKQKTLDTATIFIRSGATYEPSAAAISQQIAAVGAGFGITVGNLTPASSASLAAVKAQKDTTITLEKQIAKRTISYCVAAKGVANSNLGAMRSKLVSTFSDKRGWGLDGALALIEVSNGCDFTVWLSAASQMPSFGAICDSMWSCRVGSNVVINYDRWQNASPAWNAAGGSLDEYRSMVINHETGHWFGFYHRFCGGAGQPAPVMQQQSINLQGCKFNAWPTSAERADLKAQLGI